MTPKAQRIAIAGACGWRFPKSMEPFLKRNPDIGVMPNVAGTAKLPDYLDDLNAMHEAELSLKPEEFLEYVRWLVAKHDDQIFGMLCSTASQRAEAFLKTLGLWKE